MNYRTIKAEKVFSTRELQNENFSVYSSNKRPNGEKIGLYTQYGKYSGTKSEQRRQEIKKTFQPRKKESWEKMPTYLEQQQEQWVLDMIMGTICKTKGIRVTQGAEFNLSIPEVKGRREVLITPMD